MLDPRTGFMKTHPPMMNPSRTAVAVVCIVADVGRFSVHCATDESSSKSWQRTRQNSYKLHMFRMFPTIINTAITKPPPVRQELGKQRHETKRNSLPHTPHNIPARDHHKQAGGLSNHIAVPHCSVAGTCRREPTFPHQHLTMNTQ